MSVERWVNLELDITSGSGERLRRLVRDWVIGALRAGDAALYDDAVAMRTTPWQAPDHPDKPYGPPGAVWSHLLAAWEPGAGPVGDLDIRSGGGSMAFRPGPYSEARLDRLLSPDAALPTGLYASMWRLDGAGLVPSSVGKGDSVVHVWIDETARPGEELTAQLSVMLGPGAERHRAALSFARGWAETVDLVFGIAGPQVAGIQTPFEAVMTESSLGGVAVRQGRETLRGYSWLTVVPHDLVDRLGGVARLRRASAFAVVDELPSGALWLQATEDLADFGSRELHAVFEALAPALRPGRPVDMRLLSTGPSVDWPVVLEDAADHPLVD